MAEMGQRVHKCVRVCVCACACACARVCVCTRVRISLRLGTANRCALLSPLPPCIAAELELVERDAGVFVEGRVDSVAARTLVFSLKARDENEAEIGWLLFVACEST